MLLLLLFAVTSCSSDTHHCTERQSITLRSYSLASNLQSHSVRLLSLSVCLFRITQLMLTTVALHYDLWFTPIKGRSVEPNSNSHKTENVKTSHRQFLFWRKRINYLYRWQCYFSYSTSWRIVTKARFVAVVSLCEIYNLTVELFTWQLQAEQSNMLIC